MNELRSVGYWVGHFFTIAATIIGVYYAAIVGFDVALKVELVKADRSTYYLSESLYQELNYNVDNMEGYIERVKNEQFVFMEHLAGIKLNNYVFEASKESDSTFEVEPKLLSELSIYYFAVGSAIDYYYDTQRQSPNDLMIVIKRETAKLTEQKTLKRLAAYNKALADSIEERGVSLSQPSFDL